MCNRTFWIGVTLWTVAFGSIVPGSAVRAQQVLENPPSFAQHLASGEFAAARRAIDHASPEDRGALRQRLAVAQAIAGDTAAATDTTAGIESLAERVEVAAQLRDIPYGSRDDRAPATTTGPAPVPRAPTAAALGGGAVADFDSLMNLIQTTIAPDNWEILGGPSTMAPYPAGIHVDPDGFVRDVPIDQSDSLAAMRTRLLEPRGSIDAVGNADWTRASELRLISLRQLRESLLRRHIVGQRASTAMRNLAGLSRIQYIFIDDGDLLIAGPVGGVDPAAAPWPRDRQSGRTTLGIDELAAAAVAVGTGTAFGCSIDPTAAGLAAASKISAQIASRTQPPANAAEALADGLGRQNISVYGTPADHPLAWLLVDADRHMKQLALGQHPMPEGVPNYLELLEQEVRRRPGGREAGDQLLRMWFAVEAIQTRRSSDARLFEISGRPLRLLTAKEAAGEDGERRQAGRDPAGEAFAEAFTHHFEQIASAYPVYDRLRGAFEMTAAMKLVHDHTGPEQYDALLGELALPDFVSTGGVSVPRQCDSIAVRHTIRDDRRRHDVYVASGGVHIDPAESLTAAPTIYLPLDAVRPPEEDRPVDNARWWWDR